MHSVLASTVFITTDSESYDAITDYVEEELKVVHWSIPKRKSISDSMKPGSVNYFRCVRMCVCVCVCVCTRTNACMAFFMCTFEAANIWYTGKNIYILPVCLYTKSRSI
jgi:hypothetical protein